MNGPPKILLGDWLISLFTRRREARREALDQLRACETALAAFDCKTDGTPRDAYVLSKTFGPDAAREVLMRSAPATLAIRTARQRLAACQQTPGYNPNGWHTTKTHRRMCNKYNECLTLVSLAQSRLASLTTELKRIRWLANGLPARIEAYDNQIQKLRKVITAQFWNGTGSVQAMAACESAVCLFNAAQLAWEHGEPFVVDALLNMIEEPFSAMAHYAAEADAHTP